MRSEAAALWGLMLSALDLAEQEARRYQTGTNKNGRAPPGRAPYANEVGIKMMIELSKGGATLRGICEALEREEIPPARGGRWQAASVRAIMLRNGHAHRATP